MEIKITPHIKELVDDYRDCGCPVCAHKLATCIANRVAKKEAKNEL